MRRELFFDHALLPSGWARDVRIVVTDGIIESVAQNAAPEGAAHLTGIAIPGFPNLHSHAFQRGMAGLAERRGAPADDFWTWREVMYSVAEATIYRVCPWLIKVRPAGTTSVWGPRATVRLLVDWVELLAVAFPC